YTLHLLSRIKPDRQAALETLVPSGATVIFHDGVSDAEYARLLANDALLVSASLDEGYGLPLAESLSLGVPAVVSDLEIFHEVAGHGALYFNPHSPDEFAQAVLSASRSDTYQKLKQQGSAHITSFTWQESARILSKAIQSLIQK
ncbi:MAG TPA: glycosyltransferase, partial [Candidatus Saccharimonadales bacterium]